MTAPAIPDPGIPQRRGSDPAVSAWVSASAGTGKTKVLTDRMLRLLLGGTLPQKILCLTFTRAAAAEMSNRLNDRLAEWAEIPSRDLTAQIDSLTGTIPDDTTLAAARRLLARVLDAPGGMRIQTIHAFCQSLLGRFPLEAGISPHFEVLDERGASELMAAARETVARAAGDSAPDGALPRALDAISRYLHPDAIDGLLKTLAADRARLRAAIDRAGGGAELSANIRASLGLGGEENEQSILEVAVADGSFDGSGLRAAVQALATGSEKDRARGATMDRWLDAPARARIESLGDYRAAFLTRSGTILKSLMTKAAAKSDPNALSILAAEADRLISLGERLRAVVVADSTGALLALGEALIDAYETLKAAHARLDYDDLILKTRDLLRGDGAAAWVLYKLDGGIDHVLIDEAQDTNPEQWQVIEALAEEFFAGEGVRDVERTVFAVGDVKQSIYSFQRADPEAFGRMRAWVGARARGAARGFETVDLDVSFRSAPAILTAVDAVFAVTPARVGVVADGRVLHHEPWRHEAPGLVEVWPPIDPQETDPPAPWKPPVERIALESAPARLARLIAWRIARLCSGNDIVSALGRPIDPGDIMVLMRRRTGFVDELSRALKGLGIAVAGSDRLVLTEHIAVMDLIALGRFLLHPEDDLTLAVVLKGPFCGLDDDDLFGLAHGRVGTLWRALRRRRDDGLAGAAYERLRGLLAAADRKSPYQLYADLLEADGGRRDLLARLGPEAEDPIDEFLAQAIVFERNSAPTLEAFLDWLESGHVEIKRDLEHGHDKGSAGAVRIMTVHGAKGLEAPVVFLPDTLQVPRQSPSLLWSEDGALVYWPPRREHDDNACEALRETANAARDREYRRLLYVAMTRAQDRLYVCGWRTRRNEPEECWYHLIRDGLEGIAETIDDPILGRAPEWPGGAVLRVTNGGAGAVPAASESADVPPALGAPPGPWLREPPAEEPVPPRPLAPSRASIADPAIRSPLAAFSSGSPDQGTGAALRGQIIHKLLEYLPDVAVNRRADAARRFLARPGVTLDDEAQEEIAGAVLALLSAPAFAPLFAPGSRAEVPITGLIRGRETRVISGQIDRLAVTDDQVLIVDYKTGRAPPARIGETPVAYLRQMAAYRAGVREIFPEKTVVCALLWTEEPRLEPLPDELLDGHAP